MPLSISHSLATSRPAPRTLSLPWPRARSARSHPRCGCCSISTKRRFSPARAARAHRRCIGLGRAPKVSPGDHSREDRGHDRIFDARSAGRPGSYAIRKMTTPVPVEGAVAGGALPKSAGTSFHGRRKPNGSACHRRTMWPVQQAPQHRIRAMSPFWVFALTPSGRRRHECPLSAVGRHLLLPPPRPLPLRRHRGCSCCSRWSRSSHRSAGRARCGTRRYGR
jgi:hypothetical protein